MRQQEQILNYQFPDTTDIERLVLADAVSAPELLGEIIPNVHPDFFSQTSRRNIWEVIVKYYNEYVTLEMRVESEVSMLSEHKRELRAALRRGEYTNKEYEPLVIPINKQIENAKTELSLFKYSELNRIFPQDHIPFCQIEEYVKKLKENEQK